MGDGDLTRGQLEAGHHGEKCLGSLLGHEVRVTFGRRERGGDHVGVRRATHVDNERVATGYESALDYRDYDYQFHETMGTHNLRYASATMPETLRWLWR